LGFQNKTVAQLPVKDKKIKIKNRYLHYFIFNYKNYVYIQKRTEKGIWHNLYEFPLVEALDTTSEGEIIDIISKQTIISNKIVKITLCNSEAIIHKLSHQHLYINFWNVSVSGDIDNGFELNQLKTFPFPIVIYNFIESYF
jgi:A/G-specific adenine glycosylase